MAISEFASVFSRLFVVGFFLPAFFALAALDQLLHEGALPSSYREQSGTTQILIIGGVALLLGLLLSGLQHVVVRLLEGYPLQQVKATRSLGWLHRVAVRRWEIRFDADTEKLKGPRSSARTAAANRLQTFWPPEKSQLLPTRFGNVIRAFERHPNERYGLDGVAAWPRIASLLSEQELAEIGDRRADVALFVNGALLAALDAALVAGDALAHGGDLPRLMASVAMALVAWLLYLGALMSAHAWGSSVRAAFDLHRIELYSRLGFRTPTDNADERALAKAINRMLLYAEPVPDIYREKGDPNDKV